MRQVLSIKSVDHHKEKICEDILRLLPDWFGIESAILDYISGVGDKPMWAAYENERAIGFISIALLNTHDAEIYVMGIKEEYHRSGIGKQLIDVAIEWLSGRHYKKLIVKTLSPSRPNEHYERTRRFYEKMGFVPVEESKTIWGEANPCLVMVKVI